MPARDYVLMASPLTNTIYIAKQSKKYPDGVTDDKAKVDESDFIGVLLEWAHGSLEAEETDKVFTLNGKVIATLTLHKDVFDFDKAEFK